MSEKNNSRKMDVCGRAAYGCLSAMFFYAAVEAFPQAVEDLADNKPARTQAGTALILTGVAGIACARRAWTGRWTTPQTGDDRPRIFGS